jgi:hypothetical protein
MHVEARRLLHQLCEPHVGLGSNIERLWAFTQRLIFVMQEKLRPRYDTFWRSILKGNCWSIENPWYRAQTINHPEK